MYVPVCDAVSLCVLYMYMYLVVGYISGVISYVLSIRLSAGMWLYMYLVVGYISGVISYVLSIRLSAGMRLYMYLGLYNGCMFTVLPDPNTPPELACCQGSWSSSTSMRRC